MKTNRRLFKYIFYNVVKVKPDPREGTHCSARSSKVRWPARDRTNKTFNFKVTKWRIRLCSGLQNLPQGQAITSLHLQQTPPGELYDHTSHVIRLSSLRLCSHRPIDILSKSS